MKVLITGGAGFIGSHVVRLFVNKYPNYEIVNLDKLTYAGNLETLSTLAEDKRHILVQADIGDSNVVAELLSRYTPRAIINFAAESHVDRSITGPSDFIQTTKFRKYLVVIGVIQIGTFHAYMLYYLRIAQIRNGRFLAEVLSDVMHKKSATPELE